MSSEANTTGRDRFRQTITRVGQKLTQRFNRFPPRDRLALILLSGFMALLLLIYGIILPAVRFHENARQNFQLQQELLHWLKQQQPAIAALTTAAPASAATTGNPLTQVDPLTPVTPLTLLNNTATDYGLKIARLQPENNGNLRVWLEDVSFENTLRWLQHLQSQGMTVKEITVDQQKEGMVSIRAVF